MEEKSYADKMAELPEDVRAALRAQMTPEAAESLKTNWRFWARPKQLPPPGDWATWLLLAGRGFGKTRAGAGWVHERAMAEPGRNVALVAFTPADARDFMIEGPGGLLWNTPPTERPLYEPSKRRLTWPNGSVGTVFSDQEPDQTRGFSGDTAWIDELGKFVHAQETWDNLQFGMREASSDRPRRLITTTPRPLPVLRKIKAMPSTVTVVGSSYENRKNLDPEWFEETIQAYEGTRLGRQEIHAHILEDVPGALWTIQMLERCRVKADILPDMQRVVIGVDPSGQGGNDEGADEIGIVVCGKGVDGEGYVLADYSCSLSPDGWGRRVVEAFRNHAADRIVVERNFGGAMAAHVVRTVWRNAPIKETTSTRSKVIRAEPIAALYEKKPPRIHHVIQKDGPGFNALEDQMIAFRSDGYAGEGSPDRVDALVFALSELMLANRTMTQGAVIGLY